MCVHEEIVHGQDAVTKFYAHVRKDRDSLLQDLISSPEVGLLLPDIAERHCRLVLPGLCRFLHYPYIISYKSCAPCAG